MCDNLDVEGKRGVPWSGQSLNTVVWSRGLARASWTPTVLNSFTNSFINLE